MAIGMLVFSLPAGYLTDKVGALRMLVANEFVGAAGVLQLALGRGLIAMASAILLGASISLWITSYNTATSTILGAGNVGRVRAGVDATRMLVAIPAPIIGSTLFTYLGTTSPFITGATLMVLSTIPILKVLKGRVRS